MQLERANELGDEAMINMRYAEEARDVAEAQLLTAAQEKVAALVHLSELSSLLHSHNSWQPARVRRLVISKVVKRCVLLLLRCRSQSSN